MASPRTRRTHGMDVLLFTTMIIGSLTIFAGAAMRWGVDTRPAVTDDHRR